jgi:hypothetical protein
MNLPYIRISSGAPTLSLRIHVLKKKSLPGNKRRTSILSFFNQIVEEYGGGESPLHQNNLRNSDP